MATRKRKPESKRDHLLRLLRDADVASPDTLARWLLRTVCRSNLVQEWEDFRTEFLQRDPIQCVRGPKFQDYFIILMHQHSWLKRECEQLRAVAARDLNEEFEGAGDLVLRQLLTKDKGEYAKLTDEIERRQTEFRTRKRGEEILEELRASKCSAKLHRGRKPKGRTGVNWCKPMPVFSDLPPLGYCQATAQHERKVLEFLRTNNLHKKPRIPQRHSSRGAPRMLHSVATNLRVLDVWLGKWLSQEPDLIGDAILETLFWQASQDVGDDDVKQFRKVLLKHWLRIDRRLTNSELLDSRSFVPRVLGNDVVWQLIEKIVKKALEAADMKSESRSTPLSIPTPLAGLESDHGPAFD